MLRIKSLEIDDHSFLQGIPFELSNPNENDTKNYYSVIIGPNGTGKSNLLAFLIESFNEIVLLKNGESTKPRKQFSLIYELNSVEYEVTVSKKEVQCKINKNIASLVDIVLPSKWLGISVTINDKFPILQDDRKETIAQYSYLGIRSARNNAFVSNITKNTIVGFVEALKRGKIENLRSVYKALGLNPLIRITVGHGRMLRLTRLAILKSTVSDMTAEYNRFINNSGYTVSYRLNKYKKFVNDEQITKEATDFLKKKAEQGDNKTKLLFNYDIDLDDAVSMTELINDWNTLKILLDLELLRVEEFYLSKQSHFPFEESSSGESHLLYAFHGIIANVENNSLIIIDEPEISLHPNWQIDYLDILKTILSKHSGVHVIISTHSHFLISGLKDKESRIISMKRNNKTGEINVEKLDYETFGWEPDRILYKIFGLVTLRNKHFEFDLRTLVSLISTPNSNLTKVKKLRDQLNSFISVDEDDPLKIIISRADTFLKQHNG